MLHLARRIFARLRRNRLDDELAEEIRLHIDMRAQTLEADGIDPRDARLQAQRMFGNAMAIREAARDLWGFGWIDAFLQDLCYGARLLRRSPGFTAVAVLSLAIGIGASAAVFNVADAVLFRPLSLADPGRLHSLSAEVRAGGGSKRFGGVGDEPFAAIRRDAGFAAIIGFRTSGAVTLAGTTAGHRVVGADLVSDNYFETLGIGALAGRLLGPSDLAEGTIPVVLSERLWKAAFGGDPAVAGRRLTLNGAPAVVVGVARGFSGLLADRPADLFAPLAAGDAIDPGLAGMQIRLVTKLNPGVSAGEAAQQLKALLVGAGSSMLRGGELRVDLIDASRGIADSREPLSRPLWVGLALAGVLLLVACANTGGLLVARFSSRHGEFGVRIAIGAGRARLARQLIIEALMIAALAAVIALGIAWMAAPMLLRSVPVGAITPDFDLRFDWRLAAFTAVVTVLAATSATGASLARLMRISPSALLASDSRTAVRGRRVLTDALIAAQVACSLLLLAGAGGMARTLLNLQHVDPGFEPRSTFAIGVDASHRRLDGSAAHEYYSRLHQHVAELPLVERASVMQIGLMTGASTTGTVDIPGFVPSSDEDRWTRLYFVGAEFFETTGMRMITGESLRPAHLSARERVAVVNDQFARFYFRTPARAIGQSVNGNVRIIGVVADAHYDTLRDEAVRAMFVPFTQAPPRQQMTFVVRPADPSRPSVAVEGVTAALRAFDPQSRFTVTMGADRLASTMVRERFAAVLAAVLSFLAVFLSCLGLHGAVAYAISEREHEMALRLALGAGRGDIMRLVVRAPLQTTVLGIVVGAPGAYALMQGLSALLYGVAPFDTLTILPAAALLLGVGTLAGIPAALRAASIDPQEALRWR
jgi:predicted permease